MTSFDESRVNRDPRGRFDRSAVAAAEASDVELADPKAVTTFARQMRQAAGIRGARVDEVLDAFEAVRAQYAVIPQAQRPAPPEHWVKGTRARNNRFKGFPTDPASMWALYRIEADPELFAGGADLPYLSLDLETAGPPGRVGFKPERGHIIEVGVVEYDEHGRQLDSWSSLVDLPWHARAAHGTGAVEVHGITEDMLDGQPTWDEVGPQVAEHLQDVVLVMHNEDFERPWLTEHLSRVGHVFDDEAPSVDTAEMARRHLTNFTSARLSMVAADCGVPYTEGHRSLHDSLAGGRVFFALRDLAQNHYREHFAHVPPLR